jgi:hypothetical protein
LPKEGSELSAGLPCYDCYAYLYLKINSDWQIVLVFMG